MKPTSPNTTVTNTSGSIADAIYPDISDKSPRQIDTKLRGLSDAIQDAVFAQDRNAVICYQQDIAWWKTVKEKIEERAKKEGKR
jgi:hypothetical protein